jgi:hypothetical protein
VPLPLAHFAFLVSAVATYLFLVGLVKERVVRRILPLSAQPPPAALLGSV